MTTIPTYGQSMLAPRAMGTGALLASVRDTRGFDINPAGLVRIRDWDLTVSSFTSPGGRTSGAVFQGISLGKKFFDRHAVAFQYTPGTVLNFVVPSTVVLAGSTPVSTDEQVEYGEHFSLSYAMEILPGLSAGITGRVRTTRVTDTRFTLRDLDTTSLIVPDEQSYETTVWLGDLGFLWQPAQHLGLALVGRNIAAVEAGSLPPELVRYALPRDRRLEFGVAYEVLPGLRAGADLSTAGTGGVGVDFSPLPTLSARAGAVVATSGSPLLTGVSAGIGLSYEFVDIDLSYLHFLQQAGRSGSVSPADFDPAGIITLDLNPYAADRVGVSVKALFGSVRDRLARIEAVEITGGIYPSSSEALAYSPVGTVRVRNVSQKPIHARASFFVERFMDAPTESQPVFLQPGEDVEIPLTAVFNDRLKAVPQLTVREGTVYVNAEPAEQYDDRYQTRVLIHGRNDWDGDVRSLRYFVTPNDPEVIRTARDILLERQDSLESVPAELRIFRKVQLTLNAFAGKLMYVGDPTQSADYVQYPSETLALRGGDCDDMTVCFSSLLNSIGISTAFVDVVPPGRPRDGHIYLLVDTGLDPRFGSSITSNPKRFVVRKNAAGAETVWIPIETTVIRNGFEDAWSGGAQRYFDDVEIGLGVVKGWVRILDVH